MFILLISFASILYLAERPKTAYPSANPKHAREDLRTPKKAAAAAHEAKKAAAGSSSSSGNGDEASSSYSFTFKSEKSAPSSANAASREKPKQPEKVS